MKEKQLYQFIKRHLPKAHLTRIENTAGVGVFDLHITHDSKSMWWELKTLYKGLIEVRSSQIVWAYKELKAGKDHWFVWYDREARHVSFMRFSTLRTLDPISRSKSGIKFRVKDHEDFGVKPGDLLFVFNLV